MIVSCALRKFDEMIEKVTEMIEKVAEIK